MFNPFRIFTLAADARRIEAFLDNQSIGEDTRLLSQRVAALHADLCQTRLALSLTKGSLAEERAKIAKMTSGLRRGSKKAA